MAKRPRADIVSTVNIGPVTATTTTTTKSSGNDTSNNNNKRPRLTKETWYVRLSTLRPPSAKIRYGDRCSVAVSAFLSDKPSKDLAGFSLIIPAFTRRADIPSGGDEQRTQPWLWGAYAHPRYFGVLDMDMDLDDVMRGAAPLFTDVPVKVYKDKDKKKAVKKEFVQRLISGVTFGQLLTQCPAFGHLYHAVQELVRALEKASVEHVVYFSGGGGFRVLFHSPLAWRAITWGQLYAIAFHTQELAPLLRQAAPTLPETVLAIILAATDKNIYDCDKGTKPDLLAHFDTQVYPHPVDSQFEAALPSCKVLDPGLAVAIRAFWKRIFMTIPVDEASARPLMAPMGKGLLVAVVNKKDTIVAAAASRERTLTWARPYFSSDLYPASLIVALAGGLGKRWCKVEGKNDGEPWHRHLTAAAASECLRSAGDLRDYLASDDTLLSFHIGSLIANRLTLASSQLLLVYEAREFMLDLDLKDWKEKRSLLCDCEDKTCCGKCWLLAEMASLVCHHVFTVACQLGPMLFVYSGGKGCHLWWGHTTARQLTKREREVLAKQVFNATAPVRLLQQLPAMATALKRVWLERGIKARALLADPESPLAQFLLKEVAPAGFVWPAMAAEKTTPAQQSLARWNALEKCVSKVTLLLQVIAYIGWPCIDANVTKSNTHMIKTPFAIHSKSGKLAMPLAMAASCDPPQMPTVTQLMQCWQRGKITQPELDALWRGSVACFHEWLFLCGYPVPPPVSK